MPSKNGAEDLDNPRGADSALGTLLRHGKERLGELLPSGGTSWVWMAAILILVGPEGNGEAARISGNRVRDLNKIQSEAYRQVEEIRGMADAKATEIYAKAYNQNPEAVAFYEFTRTIEAYKSAIADNTTLVLSTDSEFFKFLNGMDPAGDIARFPRPASHR